MKEQIEKLKLSYIRAHTSSPIDKLPITLGAENDTYCRLAALFELEVEKRGNIVLDDYLDKIEKVTRWLTHSPKRGLLLMGSVGNGKSTMLHTIKYLIGYKALLSDAIGIYDYFKQHGTMLLWNEQLVIIDDLGAEPVRCTNYGEEHNPLAKLLLHRYDKQLTTIIATNLNLQDIQDRYGDRVVDRMYEMFDVIIYKRESYRRPK